MGMGDTEAADLETFLSDDLSYGNAAFLFCFHGHTYCLACHGYLMLTLQQILNILFL